MHLADVLITDELESRTLARGLDAGGISPAPFPPITADLRIVDALAARCMQVMLGCDAGSAGITMFSSGAFDTLAWVAAVGELAKFDQAVFPYSDSPCSVCFEYRKPQLFRHPHLYFEWMAHAGMQIEELLVVPIRGTYGAFFGSIWVAAHHDAARRFDAADALCLTRFGVGLWARLDALGRSARGAGA